MHIATKYVYKLGVREALASIMPPDKEQQTLTPVITGNDGKVLNVEQVLDALHFEVVHLYSSNQYCNVRRLETLIHRALHHLPVRLWFGRGFCLVRAPPPAARLVSESRFNFRTRLFTCSFKPTLDHSSDPTCPAVSAYTDRDFQSFL